MPITWYSFRLHCHKASDSCVENYECLKIQFRDIFSSMARIVHTLALRCVSEWCLLTVCQDDLWGNAVFLKEANSVSVELKKKVKLTLWMQCAHSYQLSTQTFTSKPSDILRYFYTGFGATRYLRHRIRCEGTFRGLKIQTSVSRRSLCIVSVFGQFSVTQLHIVIVLITTLRMWTAYGDEHVQGGPKIVTIFVRFNFIKYIL